MPRRVSALLCVVASLMAPSPARGQAGLLERWTVDYLGAGWVPRWAVPDGPAATDAQRIELSARASTVRLRRAVRQAATSIHVSMRQPVSSSLALRVSAGGDARRTLTEGRRLIETPRSQAVAGGVELRHALSALDVVEAVAMAGWDGGVGGEVRVSLAGEGYFVAARGWRSHTQTSFVYFPADSLRDLGVRQLIRGLRIEAGADVALGPVALHPVARVELTSLDETSETSEAFLFTSPQGESHTVELGADASWGRWEVDLEHRRRDVDMEARLLRSGASAGRLFYADADYRSWAVGAAMRAASGRWSLRAGRERTEGVLSTRVETWPFVSLWEQVTTQAYRLRGGLDGESLQLGLGRAPVAASGWSWGASVGRYVFRADRESWFVTGFGFGRSDQEETVEGVDPAIFVGGHAGRTFTLGPGTADARLEGGVPVHATEIPGAGTGGGPASDRGVAGYVAVSVAWRW